MPHPHWDLTSKTLSGVVHCRPHSGQLPGDAAVPSSNPLGDHARRRHVAIDVATATLRRRSSWHRRYPNHDPGDLLLVLVAPLWLAVSTIVGNLDDIADLVQGS